MRHLLCASLCISTSFHSDLITYLSLHPLDDEDLGGKGWILSTLVFLALSALPAGPRTLVLKEIKDAILNMSG